MTLHTCLSLFLFAPVALASPTLLTLEGSIERAQTEGTPVLHAQNNDNAAAVSLVKGYAQFLPNLQGTFSFGYEKGNKFYTVGAPAVFNTENYGFNYQLTSTLNIFNGLADWASLKAAIERRDFATLTLARAKQLIALDVAQSFLQVLLDRKIVAIHQSALDASKAQEALVAKQVEVGSGKPSDLASARAQTSQNQSLVLSALNQVRTDLLLLVQKLRLNVKDDYEIKEPKLNAVSTIDSKYANEDDLIDEALANRADLKAAKRNATAAEWDVTNAASGYWPTLNAQFALYSNARELIIDSSGGVNYVPPVQTNLFTQLGNNNYYDITLNLSWNIFDQWTTPRNVAVANATARNLRVDAGDQERQVTVDVRKGLLDYKTASALMDSTAAGAQSAEEAYNLVKGRFDAGIVNFSELQLAQSTLVAAQSAKEQAVVSLELKKRALDTAIGR